MNQSVNCPEIKNLITELLIEFDKMTEEEIEEVYEEWKTEFEKRGIEQSIKVIRLMDMIKQTALTRVRRKKEAVI